MTRPIIENASAKIATLERRHDHLSRRLERGEFSSTASADFDRAEVAALTAAIEALKYVVEIKKTERLRASRTD